MELLHIKMKNGEDILAQKDTTANLDNEVYIVAPVSIQIDPVHGFFAKSWLLLSEGNTVGISKNDILFCHNASEKARSYYEEFLYRISEEEPSEDEQYASELEEVFQAMMEAKTQKIN